MSENIFIKKTAEEKLFGVYGATYSLYEILLQDGIYYAVEIKDAENSELAVIGKDIDAARSFYQALISTSSTSSTLCEIVSDKIQEMKY